MTVIESGASGAIPTFGQKMRDVWRLGDYSVIGTTLQLCGELLCEAADIAAGERVLDVAAGNGNAALAAARRGGEVIASDYVQALLDDAAARAVAEGLELALSRSDAEELPFEDGSFDLVLSSFGVMFTTDHAKAAAELIRVCRPGGRIGLASWTPDSFIGRVLATVRQHAVQPPGAPSPLVWGDPRRLAALLGGEVTLRTTVREHIFRYRSPQVWLATFRTFYGPMNSAFNRPDVDVDSLQADLLSVVDEFNTARDGRMRVPGSYLEAVAVRRPTS